MIHGLCEFIIVSVVLWAVLGYVVELILLVVRMGDRHE